jgi:hypothetical protein
MSCTHKFIIQKHYTYVMSAMFERDVRREFVVRRYRFTTELTKKAYKLKQILNIVTISKCKFDIYYTKFNSECCYESEKQPTDQDERTKVEGQKLLKQKNKLAITSSL